jgi:hypothetical protein
MSTVQQTERATGFTLKRRDSEGVVLCHITGVWTKTFVATASLCLVLVSRSTTNLLYSQDTVHLDVYVNTDRQTIPGSYIRSWNNIKVEVLCCVLVRQAWLNAYNGQILPPFFENLSETGHWFFQEESGSERVAGNLIAALWGILLGPKHQSCCVACPLDRPLRLGMFRGQLQRGRT